MISNDLKRPQKIEFIKPVSNQIDANNPAIKTGELEVGDKVQIDDGYFMKFFIIIIITFKGCITVL